MVVVGSTWQTAMLSPKGTWPHQLEPPGQKVISRYCSLNMETAENLNTTIHSPVSKTGKKTLQKLQEKHFFKKKSPGEWHLSLFQSSSSAAAMSPPRCTTSWSRRDCTTLKNSYFMKENPVFRKVLKSMQDWGLQNFVSSEVKVVFC